MKSFFSHLSKKAFTMIELVFVIVVIGIIAAVVIPNTRTNPLQEAALQVLSHIRYTQHLALVSDQYQTGVNWWRARWQIYFQHDQSGNQNVVYTIYSDRNHDGVAVSPNPNAGEIAKDPMSGLDLTGNSLYGTTFIKSMNLSAKYGVVLANMNNLMRDGCANARRIFFDNLGRPMLQSDTSPQQQLLAANCTIRLTDGTEFVDIRITPETGYACILDAGGNCI
ncbi:MAG: prepilin-type N-terminal cleavage/methylation domain-containing protein [Campylobacterales bacterium]|nr:prepilin-type N-terminal cleavage/methylation domain-containing protein [Campylobacterales bacterium]